MAARPARTAPPASPSLGSAIPKPPQGPARAGPGVNGYPIANLFINDSFSIEAGKHRAVILGRSNDLVTAVAGTLDALRITSATADIPLNLIFATRVGIMRARTYASRVVDGTVPSREPLALADVIIRTREINAPGDC